MSTQNGQKGTDMDLSYKSHAFWLNEAFRDMDGVVNKARETLENVDYDTMVGTGLSGSLVIPVLAREFGKYFAIVRKGEQRHSTIEVEGQIGHKWIFVDDFISSGDTRNRVKNAVRGVTGNPDLYVGSYLYHPNRFELSGFEYNL
jgi:orotate phosphoribosyltransferase-like protein